MWLRHIEDSSSKVPAVYLTFYWVQAIKIICSQKSCTHVHMHTGTHVHTCTHTDMPTHRHAQLHTQTYTCTHNMQCRHIRTHARTHAHRQRQRQRRRCIITFCLPIQHTEKYQIKTKHIEHGQRYLHKKHLWFIAITRSVIGHLKCLLQWQWVFDHAHKAISAMRYSAVIQLWMETMWQKRWSCDWPRSRWTSE